VESVALPPARQRIARMARQERRALQRGPAHADTLIRHRDGSKDSSWRARRTSRHTPRARGHRTPMDTRRQVRLRWHLPRHRWHLSPSSCAPPRGIRWSCRGSANLAAQSRRQAWKLEDPLQAQSRRPLNFDFPLGRAGLFVDVTGAPAVDEVNLPYCDAFPATEAAARIHDGRFVHETGGDPFGGALSRVPGPGPAKATDVWPFKAFADRTLAWPALSPPVRVHWTKTFNILPFKLPAPMHFG